MTDNQSFRATHPGDDPGVDGETDTDPAGDTNVGDHILISPSVTAQPPGTPQTGASRSVTPVTASETVIPSHWETRTRTSAGSAPTERAGPSGADRKWMGLFVDPFVIAIAGGGLILLGLVTGVVPKMIWPQSSLQPLLGLGWALLLTFLPVMAAWVAVQLSAKRRQWR